MKRLVLLCLMIGLLPELKLNAQCANNNTLLMSFTPACTGSPETITNCIQGGQYIALSVTSGYIYTISTCGNSAFDTQITIYNSTGGGFLGYSDDACGLQSTVIWTANFTGTLWVLVDLYNCISNTTCIPITVSCNLAPPPPPNDDPCTATALTVGTTCVSQSATTTGATGTAGVAAPGCASYNGADVWFTAVVPASGSLIFATQSGVVTDGGMAFYLGSSCSGALTMIQCVDNVGANQMPSALLTGLTPGAIVYIRFWEYGGNNNGSFSICASQGPPPPSNDNPCNATALPVDVTCVSQSATTYGATGTTSVAAPGCASYNGADVWFTAIVPLSGSITVVTQSGVVLDGGMAFYTGASCGGSLTMLQCVDNVGANLMPSAVLSALTPGSTLYIRFWEYGGDNNGSFSICAYDNSPPPSSGCLSPLPEICATACNLGTLPTPLPCSGGGTISIGNTAIFNLSNINAVAESPYSAVAGCAVPGADVWFRFQATGTQLVLAITSSASNPLNNPNVSLYNGNNCNALLPLACFTGTGGSLNQTYSPITPNDYYYLQISGGNINDVGLFTLAIHNNYDCDNCLLQEDLQVTPPPVNGTYGAGQTVQFCFTVSNYNQTAANWLHGIDLNFGAGWNMSTLTATSIPASCATTTGATWGFYNSVTGTHAGIAYGPGFFYETTAGSSSGVIDGNPGNNFGDVGVGLSCPRTFCWSITTLGPGSCTTGASLAVAINTLGDSESGSWGSGGCTNDPVVNFVTTLACCAQPMLTVTNTNCGLTDGKIRAQGQGSAPWHYQWATSGGTPIADHTNVNGADSIMNLASGNYLLTVTDNLGCSVGTTITVSGSSIASTVASNTGPYCAGQTISLNATGAGTTYTWSGPGGYTDASASPTIPNATTAMTGTYSVTVTFGAGCTATASTNVMVNALPVAVISPATATICNGASVTLTASGGTNYTWSNAAGTPAITVSPTTSTTYSVTVADATACTATASRLVTVNPVPVAAIAPAAVTMCAGASATLTASGGGTYAWSNTASTAAITVSPATTTPYTVTVTNAGNCTATASATVTVNQLPVAAISPAVVSICNGTSTTLTASGGPGYTWSNAATTAAITVSPSTTTAYSVTVTDANSCTATASSTVTVNSLPVAAITPASITICSGTSTTLTATGGPGYTWSNAANTASITVSPTANTTYSVTVSDANSCTATASRLVTVVPAMVLSTTVTNVNCNGATTGAVNLTVSSGQPGYTFLWSNSANTEDLSAIPAAVYTVTVTDNNLCSATVSATVTQPTAQALSETHTDVACNGATPGSIDITNSGGVSPYTYAWNDGASTQDRTGIQGGNYILTVTDNNLCTATIAVLINSGSGLTLSETHTDVLCSGGNNAAITLTVTGASSPYTFAWNDGPTTQSRTALTAGTYTVSVFDATTCSATLSVVISEPTAFTGFISHTNVACNGGSTGTITLTPMGGTLPYTFAWSDGPTTQNRTGLAAGNYSVTATDNHNCSFAVSALLTQPALLTVSETHTNALCNGSASGSIDLTAGGGTLPYTYLWNDGPSSQNRTAISAATYTATVTDNNSCTVSIAVIITEPLLLTLSETHTDVLCNGAATGSITITPAGGTLPLGFMWNDGVTTQNRTALSAGNYTVTVTDNNTCSASVAAVITQPAALVVTETHVNVLCNGNSTGSVNLTSTGGTSPYGYNWNDGITTEDRAAIPANNYSVTVTDLNSCSFGLSVQITEPSVLTLSETHVDVACAGGNTGSIDVTVSGATAPYSYMWNDGITTEDRTAIANGNYAVTVTDNNACSSSIAIAVVSASGLSISETHTDITCNGLSDATISVTVNGGAPPYTYLWNDGVATQNRSAIPVGNYSVSATDNNACVVSLSVSITEPSALAVNETHTDVLCNGGTTGTIDITATGATPPYTYLWNNNAGTAEDRASIPAGNYSVTVSDNNSCSALKAITVAEPTALILTETHTDVQCAGGSTGSIDVTTSGGTAPYSHLWNDAAVTEDRAAIPAGNYTVVASDNNACTASISVVIGEPTAVAATGTHTDVSCNGGSDGTIDITATGGTGPYGYLWSNSLTAQTGTGLAAGAYTVTVSDVNSCSTSIAVTLAEPTAITLSHTEVNVSCKGYSDGAITVTVSGGTPPYTFKWDDGTPAQNRTNLAAGNYVLTVTDNNFCPASTGALITEPAGMILTTSFVNPSCETKAPDGSITLDITGGSGNYLYNWSNGATTANQSNLAPGNYLVTVSDVNNCTAGANFTLVYLYDFTIDATPAVTINFGESTTLGYTLTGTAGNYVSVWSPSASLSCADCASPVASPTTNTVYVIQVTNDAGCAATDQVAVTVLTDYTIFVPNAFTPNNDGNNDVFAIYGNLKFIAFLDVQIFNRWGEKIFESQDHNFSWDGMYKGVMQPPGVYSWQMKLTYLDGHREELRKGTVTLIR